MDGEIADNIPCTSVAVDSSLRLATAGFTWGFFYGHYEARKEGLGGGAKASFLIKSVGRTGLHCGLVAGVFSATHCQMQRYRMKKDWVNDCIAGVVAGTASAVVSTRSWMQVFGTATLISIVAIAADCSTSN